MYTLTGMLTRLALHTQKCLKVLQNSSYRVYSLYSKATWKQATLSFFLCSKNNIVSKPVHSSISSSVCCQCFMYTIQIWLIPTLMVWRLQSRRYISIKSPCKLSLLQFNGIQSHPNDPWMACIPDSAVWRYESSSQLNAMASPICFGVPQIRWPSFNGAWMCPPTSTAPHGNAESAMR